MNTHPSQLDDDLVELPPSKTKIKKQMHELQNLGEELTKLPKEKLRELNLPETLLDALMEYKRMTKFGALNRQLQYIGRLMRDDPQPITEK
jgi:ribosome-associated protein